MALVSCCKVLEIIINFVILYSGRSIITNARSISFQEFEVCEVNALATLKVNVIKYQMLVTFKILRSVKLITLLTLYS